jgi:enoyl-CoA hydratase
MESDILQYEKDGPIGVLTLNRPERLNAISHDMLRGLLDFWDERMHDYATRVVIVTGAGRGFCAGLDLKAWPDQGAWQEGVGAVQNSFSFQWWISEMVNRMRRAPQPVIAAVNGAAAGGGISIALASDIRVASPAARFACSFINLGLSAADVGASFFLPRLVGPAVAADMMYTGRLVGAEEAYRVGLVNEVVEPDQLRENAMARAREMVRRSSPFGLRMSKEVLSESVNGLHLEGVLKLENRTQIMTGQAADAQESLAAFLEKRDPTWQDA